MLRSRHGGILKPRDWMVLLALTILAVTVNGYHLGQQDQAIYLPAIKKNLDPGLYPHDAVFFYSQTRWMLFDEFVAGVTRLTRLPLEVVILVLHLATVFLFLLACRKLALRFFLLPVAQWTAVATLAIVMLMPVAGTQLQLMERYLHPRNMATVALLFALLAVLDRKPAALAWLAVAAVMHPTMALLGLLHLTILFWKTPVPRLGAQPRLMMPLLLLMGVNPAWHGVLSTRAYLYPLQWQWYEWLGIVAPLAFLGWVATTHPRCTTPGAEYVARRLLISTGLGLAAAMCISTIAAFDRLVPAEPMRVFHLTSVFFALLAGGMLGSWLGRRPAMLAVFLLVLAAGMHTALRLEYDNSAVVAWPETGTDNDWAKSYDWIQQHTPRGALFALDPRHMQEEEQDSHGFRALAERSMLADWVKDRAVTALTPTLAYTWREETAARERWDQFGPGDFQRLKEDFGVDWVVWEHPPVAGMECPYQNPTVRVCRIL